jgi:hypothetical protein
LEEVSNGLIEETNTTEEIPIEKDGSEHYEQTKTGGEVPLKRLSPEEMELKTKINGGETKRRREELGRRGSVLKNWKNSNNLK